MITEEFFLGKIEADFSWETLALVGVGRSGPFPGIPSAPPPGLRFGPFWGILGGQKWAQKWLIFDSFLKKWSILGHSIFDLVENDQKWSFLNFFKNLSRKFLRS